MALHSRFENHVNYAARVGAASGGSLVGGAVLGYLFTTLKPELTFTYTLVLGVVIALCVAAPAALTLLFAPADNELDEVRRASALHAEHTKFRNSGVSSERDAQLLVSSLKKHLVGVGDRIVEVDHEVRSAQRRARTLRLYERELRVFLKQARSARDTAAEGRRRSEREGALSSPSGSRRAR